MRSTDTPPELPSELPAESLSGPSSSAGAVFDAHVVPAAEARCARGASGVPLGPDPAASSYFVTRTRRSLARADFEWPAVSRAAELRDRLRAIWAGDPELLALIEPLLSLVRMPKAEAAQGGAAEGSAVQGSAVQGSAVPDHIYPMY